MSEIDPIIGHWYKNQETRARFEVVALDEDSDSIEIQYIEGEIEELDSDTWTSLLLEQIEASEDWSRPFGSIESEDLGYSDAPAGGHTNGDPLDSVQ